jgi:hypothetical protein
MSEASHACGAAGAPTPPMPWFLLAGGRGRAGEQSRRICP